MVLFLTERNPSHPVVALTSDNITVANYKHCAEIEKSRRMTNKELNKQLTKAKELIKEMLSILPKENIEGIYEITEEAEEFLKGE